MSILKTLLFLIIFFIPVSTFAQNGNGIKKILDELGVNARSYLLSATRPSYSVSAYTLGKNQTNININAVFSEELLELPVSFTYGITDKADIFTEASVLTQSYNFNGDKISGFGDIVAGVRYQFQESEYFSHSLQTAIKIPTASKSKELGTGLLDFHLGIAQGFSYKNFSYDLSVELDFLRRREIPAQRVNIPGYIKNIIDSVRSIYDYKYEKELVVSGGPGFSLTDRVSIYSGMSFTRNFKLDYNTLQSYLGSGFLLSDKISLGIGASFGLINSGSWSISSGVSILF